MEFIVKCQIANVDWYFLPEIQEYQAFSGELLRGRIKGGLLSTDGKTPASLALMNDWIARNANNNN